MRVDTADGLTGDSVGGGGAAGIHVIHTALRALLLGLGATDVEALWQRMYRATLPYGQKGLALMAMSGVDLALWDLRAKRAGQPLVTLLGGQNGQPMPCYKTGWSVKLLAWPSRTTLKSVHTVARKSGPYTLLPLWTLSRWSRVVAHG